MTSNNVKRNRPKIVIVSLKSLVGMFVLLIVALFFLVIYKSDKKGFLKDVKHLFYSTFYIPGDTEDLPTPQITRQVLPKEVEENRNTSGFEGKDKVAVDISNSKESDNEKVEKEIDRDKDKTEKDSLELVEDKDSRGKSDFLEICGKKWYKTKKSFSFIKLPKIKTGLPWYKGRLYGKVSFINLWASWCSPCKSEMPYIEYLHDFLKSKKMRRYQVLSFNLDHDISRGRRFVYKTKMKVLSLYAYREFKWVLQKGIPTNWITDKKGVVRYRSLGFSRECSKDEWSKEIVSLMQYIS